MSTNWERENINGRGEGGEEGSFRLLSPTLLSVVGAGGRVAAGAGPVGVDKDARLTHALVGVRAKVVALGLDQVGRQRGRAVAVVEGQGGAEGRHGDAVQRGRGNHAAPGGLGVVDGVGKEVVEEEVLHVRVGVKGRLDLAEEDTADDAAAAPHESNARVVELPLELLGRRAHEHKALRIGDDLGGVEGLANVLDKVGDVAVERRGLRALETLASALTLTLERGEAAGEDGLGNQSDGGAHVQRVDRRPLAGALLAGRVLDLLHERLAIGVLEGKDVARDFDEERVQLALVPLLEDLAHVVARQVQNVLHQVVGLTAELHVAVLNAVVHHLDVMARAVLADPVAAGLAVGLGRDLLEDGLDVRPGSRVAARHQRRAVARTLLAARDA
eukprot:m.63469 g.63469  ORF g.63469 m.63469 type:complete len:387 (+) comp13851_c0_seq2:114-1274(+)